MSISKASGAKGRCDDLASLITRSAGECLRCHLPCTCPNFPKSHTRDCKLTNSHIVGRRYAATFSDQANLQCLCYSCHRRFTDWPVEFTRWIHDTIGSEAYDALKAKAEIVTKMNWNEELVRLKALAKELGI